MNKINTHLNLFASERFLKNYRTASLSLQRFAEGNIHDLINRYRSDYRLTSNLYDKLAHCKARILEGDLSGGCRFLFDYSENCITLLDMGDHDIVKRYNDDKYSVDMLQTIEAPSQFFPERQSKFFIDYPDASVSVNYMEEDSAEWLYCLENEQKEILEEIGYKILEEIEYKFHHNRKDFSTFIVGGPGTGKTCILLGLLKLCSGCDYKVGISISNEVMQYIEETAYADIAQFRVKMNAMPKLDLLLVDDPSRAELEQAISLKESGTVKTIIAAFDPLQLDETISDQEFNKIRCVNKIKVRSLKQCYRQKENLGRNTKRIVQIIAESTPFVAEHKIQAFHNEHKKLTDLSNNLEFVNPNGYIKTYVNTTYGDIQAEISRISNSHMWQHCQGLLLLLGNYELDSEAETLFKRLIRKNYVKTISFDENSFHQVNKVKGLEFQHVFAFINKKLFDDLQNGFRGTGQNVYKQRRLLRIPFSRAKDSLVTFAID